MTSSIQSEKTIVHAVLTGDTPVFGTLVDRHFRSVYSVAFAQCNNHADAEDVSQEAFLAAYQTLDTLREPSRFEGWVTSIARNIGRNKGRRTRRTLVLEDANASYPTSTANEVTQEEIHRIVHESVEKLDVNSREVLHLHYFAGKSTGEIAELLESSQPAILKRLQRGRERLGERLLNRYQDTFAAKETESERKNRIVKSIIGVVPAWAASGATSSATTIVATNGVSGLSKVLIAMAAACVLFVVGSIVVMEADSPMNAEITKTSAELQEPANEIESSEVPLDEAQAERFEMAQATPDLVDDSTVRGTILSVTGFPRSVELFPMSDTTAHRRTDDSTLEGAFEIENLKADETKWLAKSRPTRRMALFSIPESATARSNLQVNLDMYETRMVGHIKSGSGDGVPKANLAVKIVRANGEETVFKSLLYMYTKTDGYYDVEIATEDGSSVSVGIRAPGSGEVLHWSEAIVTKGETYNFQFPDVIIPDELAQNVDENTEIPARYKKDVFEPARAPYGGTVVDEDGNPVAGVTLDISYSSKPGFSASGIAVSDEEGKWKTWLPKQLDNVRVSAEHRDYVNGWLTRTRSTNLPLARLIDLTSELVMIRGSKVSGYVRDSDGVGVPDALIDPGTIRSFATTNYGSIPTENETTARTNAEGYFELRCMPDGPGDILVLSKGNAPAAISVDVFDGMEPAEITVDQGGVIRGRFLDEDGNPLEGAYLYSRDWKDEKKHRQVNIRAESNADGYFELLNVPLAGSIQYSFGQRRGKSKVRGKYISMSGEMEPREEPYEIVLYRSPVISGTVVDDETGEPITEFNVNGGWQWANSDQYYFDRMGRATDVTSDTGEFTKPITGVSITYPPDIPFVVQISADGYHSVISPETRLGQPSEPVAIRLRRGALWQGQVVSADGQPVSGVTVAQVQPGEKAYIQNGVLQFDTGKSPANRLETNADGSFSFPPNQSRCAVVAVHRTGYAYLESEGALSAARMVLSPWAKVEGTVTNQTGGDMAAYMEQVQTEDEKSNSFVRWYFSEMVEKTGAFEFDFVPSETFVIRHALLETGPSPSDDDPVIDVEPDMVYTVNIDGEAAQEETIQ